MSALLAYLFYFIAASASPLQRRALAVRKSASANNQIVFAFYVHLGIAILALIVLPFFVPFSQIDNIPRMIGLIVVTGICGMLTVVMNYVAQQHVDASVTSVVSNIYTPVTIILATFFLNERLTSLQIIGTAVLLIAVVVISKKHRTGRFRFDKYFLMMMGSGIVLSGVLLAERTMQKEFGFTTGTLLSWWSVALFLGIATALLKSKNTYSVKEIGTTTIFRFLQQLSWVTLVFVVGNLSLVSAVTTFKVVIVFIAAAVFLKERDHLVRKIIGSILAVVGLLLMK